MASQNRMGWLIRRLKVVQKMSPSPSVLEELRRVEQELRGLRKQQETGAWQRCRPFILRDRDKNTASFHSKASNRRKCNHLKFLEDSAGVKHRSREGLQRVIVNYFSNFFPMSHPEITVDQVDFISGRVSSSMAEDIDRPYSHQEVEA